MFGGPSGQHTWYVFTVLKDDIFSHLQRSFTLLERWLQMNFQATSMTAPPPVES